MTQSAFGGRIVPWRRVGQGDRRSFLKVPNNHQSRLRTRLTRNTQVINFATLVSFMRLPWRVGAAVFLLIGLPARAAFVQITQPDTTYSSSTIVHPIVAADFTDLSTLDGPRGMILFSVPVQVRTVPDNWNTWNSTPATESSFPRVLFANNGSSLTMVLPRPVSVFGFEAQPESFRIADITVEFFSDMALVGTISRDVDGFGGALLFAGSTDASITSVRITTDDIGFALAQIRLAIPEPPSVALLGAGVVGLLGSKLARHRKDRRAGAAA